MSRAGIRIEKYGNWILDHAVLVIILCLILSLACMLGISQLRFISDVRIFFSEDDPALAQLEAIEQTYTKNNDALIVIHSAQGTLFEPEPLRAIHDLTEAAWQLHDAYRVDSIINFQHSFVAGDDLLVEGLFERLDQLSADEIAQRAEIALTEPRLVNKLISAEGATTAVLVTFQIPDDEEGYLAQIIPEIRQLIAQAEAAHPELSFYLTGNLPLDNAFIESALYDAQRLMPVMFLAIVFILLLMLRSIYATLVAVLVIVLATGSALGLAGWLGINLSMAVVPAPAMVMTLALADAVHVLVLMFILLREGLDRRAALLTSLKRNFAPVFLTSFTTAVGFLALNFNDVAPFRDLGNIAAIGIVLAFFLSLTLAPALMHLLPINLATKRDFGADTWLLSLSDFVIKQRKGLLWFFLAATLLSVYLLPRNQLNNNFVDFFSPQIEFRSDTDFTMEQLTGIYLLEYSMAGEGANAVADPAYLQSLDAFVTWLRAQPQVMHVASVTDIFKRLNQNMHQGDPARYSLPEERDLAAQYLLLYELSLPFGLDLNNQLNANRSASRLVITLKDISTNEILEFAARSEQWLAQNTPALATQASGSTLIFARMYQRTTAGMILGTLMSLLTITLLLMLMLRSLRYALVSLIPNMLPAVLAFGIWSLLVGEVNMGVSMVLTMTLGIVVDDTIHFMSKYLVARREGLDALAAVRYSYRTVGSALIVTSVAVALGFIILAQSSFALNSQSALLSAITIMAALATDLLLLPPLLMSIDTWLRARRQQAPQGSVAAAAARPDSD